MNTLSRLGFMAKATVGCGVVEALEGSVTNLLALAGFAEQREPGRGYCDAEIALACSCDAETI